jgi:hypothetical protein
MRTKLILTTAALGVASLGAFAQVYSVNAVGYINVTVPANGLALVANQLNTGEGATMNRIPDVFTAPRDGMIVYKYTSGSGFSINSATDVGDGFEWDNPNQTLSPGEGAFVQNPENTPMTITFVGEVPQGNLSTPIAVGLNLVSSQVPQAGELTPAGLGFPAADGDLVYKYDEGTQAYEPVYEFLVDAWDGRVPSVEVGEAFFVNKAAATTWTREFSVND